MIRLFVFSPLCVGPNATLIPHDAPARSWNEPLGEMSSPQVLSPGANSAAFNGSPPSMPKPLNKIVVEPTFVTVKALIRHPS